MNIPCLSWDDDCRSSGLVSLPIATEAVGPSSIAWLLAAWTFSSVVIRCFHHYSTCKV